MVQSEIYQLLLKKGKPLSGKEIADSLKIKQTHAYRGLKKLYEAGEICTVDIEKDMANKLFGCKRRFRLFFAPEIISVDVSIKRD